MQLQQEITVHLLKVFLMGMFISFLGSLPLGTMNVAATHIAVQDGLPAAFKYATGSMLVEVLYVRVTLVAMDWISKQDKIFRVMEWLTVYIIFSLAIGSFVAAGRKSGVGNALPIHSFSPFLVGVFLSATNPLHIPFWFGWSTLLINKAVLLPQNKDYNFYVAGIGIGTLMGFTVFIFGGNYLVNHLKANQNFLNWIIGFILLITALIQVYKIRKNSSRFIIRNT